MTIIVDLLGSWIIRGSLIIVMLTMTVNLNNTLYQSSQQAKAKQLIVAVDSIIYSDLNMAGYNVPAGTAAFQTIADTNVVFYGDVDRDNIPETVRYWTSYDNTTGLRNLYRYVNNENGGVDFLLGKNFNTVTFLYYANDGKLTIDHNRAVAVRVRLTTQTANRVSDSYSSILKPFYVSTDFQVHPVNL